MVLSHDFSGSKQLVLRGVKHNTDMGSLTSSLGSVHPSSTDDGCETDLLGVKHWQTSLEIH